MYWAFCWAPVAKGIVSSRSYQDFITPCAARSMPHVDCRKDFWIFQMLFKRADKQVHLLWWAEDNWHDQVLQSSGCCMLLGAPLNIMKQAYMCGVQTFISGIWMSIGVWAVPLRFISGWNMSLDLLNCGSPKNETACTAGAARIQ